MSLVDDLKAISGNQYVNVFILIFASVTPGFLLIFTFLPEYFKELDLAKLILFSSCLSVPQFILVSFMMPSARQYADDLIGTMVYAAMFFMSVSTISIFLCYIYQLIFIYYAGIMVIMVLILSFVVEVGTKQQESRDKFFEKTSEND